MSGAITRARHRIPEYRTVPNEADRIRLLSKLNGASDLTSQIYGAALRHGSVSWPESDITRFESMADIETISIPQVVASVAHHAILPWPVGVPPEILNELMAVQSEARTDGYPVPSDTLVESARRLLHTLYRIAPLRYRIYPEEEGEISIGVRREPVGAVVLLCHEKETWCVTSIGDQASRAWCRSRDPLPDEFEAFVTRALHALPVGDTR